MCGIVGYAGLQDSVYLSSMNSRQQHRGPDASGEYWDKESSVGLAMCRLSILDLEGGRQPMSTEDDNFIIVYNGEVFNAQDIRSALEKKGAIFLTDHSDTEVILKGYQYLGQEIVKMLNGMFAFVLYDKRKKIIFGARDPFGIKPLYVHMFHGGIAWASELKSLTCLPSFSCDLDPIAVQQYLGLQYIPQERSIYQCVKKLLPGYQFIYDIKEKRYSDEPFYQLPLSNQFDIVDRQYWVEILQEEFKKAVERWSCSDVPIACSLSGGVDSAAIVASLCRSGHSVKTYTLGFNSVDGNSLNELDEARQIARLYDTDHHEIVLDIDMLLQDLSVMVRHLDEPYGGGLPSWFVFKEIAKDVKVAMTGSGGDEIFSNYSKFLTLEKRRFFSKALRYSEEIPMLSHLLSDVAKGVFSIRSILQPSFYRSLQDSIDKYILHDAPDFWLHPFGITYPTAFGTGFNIRYCCDNSRLSPGREALERSFKKYKGYQLRDRCVAVDLNNQLPDEFLLMTDRFSMAHSLEARTPFLDMDFVKLALKIPPEIRLTPNEPKSLFKDSMKRYLPPGYTDLPKKGFILPIARWLKGPLKKIALDLFDHNDLKNDGYVISDFREKFYKPLLNGDNSLAESVWTVFMLRYWQMESKL